MGREPCNDASSPESLWDDEEWMDWFNERPPAIQALIRQFPPNKPYRVGEGAFPALIYSYDEEKSGGVSMTVQIESPFFPRQVFGVKPEGLTEWDGDLPNVQTHE